MESQIVMASCILHSPKLINLCWLCSSDSIQCNMPASRATTSNPYANGSISRYIAALWILVGSLWFCNKIQTKLLDAHLHDAVVICFQNLWRELISRWNENWKHSTADNLMPEDSTSQCPSLPISVPKIALRKMYFNLSYLSHEWNQKETSYIFGIICAYMCCDLAWSVFRHQSLGL